ncbi:MAG: hypothetical protein KF729_14545 [Sandaracinaceae bacterium]|nr:hypothetical protein [Sandaracinaceae bacterium]
MIEIEWKNATDEDLAHVRPMLATAHAGGRALVAVRPVGRAAFQVELRLGEGDYATRVRLRGQDPVELIDRALGLLRVVRHVGAPLA